MWKSSSGWQDGVGSGGVEVGSVRVMLSRGSVGFGVFDRVV